MVVFSLQTFINTFFYVQSSGWARRDCLCRTEEANGCQRTATPPHNRRGGRRGRLPVAATNRHRMALLSTQQTAEKADVRGGPRMLDVQTRDNLVW
jgi:hypothetical protein